jgi:hypothetical protein
MKIPLPLLLFGLLLLAPALPARAGDDKKAGFIDLQPKANQKLDEDFHRDDKGNHLGALPKGEATYAKIKFKVGAGVAQLGSTLMKDRPEKIEGIKVGQKLARLHILHGTAFGGGMEGDQNYVADDTTLGEYKVHYADKTAASIPLVYGKDLRDWWNVDNSKETPRAKIAWEGENDFCKQFNLKLRLYAVTWRNPHPDKTVATIDFITNGKTAAAPFLVALTAETASKDKGK